MQNTLLLLTFDEVGTSGIRNTVFALLLGDALPRGSAGTTDDNFYTHYSQISTVEANWNLHTLGRWDVGANVFSVTVGNNKHDCDAPQAWSSPPPFSEMLFDQSYPGPLNGKIQPNTAPWPAPDVDAEKCGRKVLPRIVDIWKGDQADNYYSDGQTPDIPDGLHPPIFGDEPDKKKWYKPRRNAS